MSPCGSSRYVSREWPSDAAPGVRWCCQLTTSFRGGSISRTSPLSATRPSGAMIFHDAPFFQAHSCQVSHQYLRVNSGSVRAFQSLSGVVRMYVTYAKRDSAIGLSFELLFEVGEGRQSAPLELADPPLRDLVDWDGVQEVPLLAPPPEGRHERRRLQHLQVLGHGLAGHVQVGAELP